MFLHAASSAARELDDASSRRDAVPSIPVAPPPVMPFLPTLPRLASTSPSVRYPSNSWASFVPSAVARLCPVPAPSSILTLADLQCRDRLRDASRLFPLLPDEAIARMLGSPLAECYRTDPAHIAYLILQILVCFGTSTLSPVATTLRDLHDAATASHTRISTSLSGLSTRALFDRRQRGLTRATSLLTLQRGLTWLTTHGGFEFPLDCSLLHNLRPTQRPSSSAPCVMSLGILARLERFAVSSTGSVFERSHAAAWASQILSVSRFTQIQHRSDPATAINTPPSPTSPSSCSSSPLFHAQDALTDKVSRSRRAFWIPLRGITGADLDSVLCHTFSDITNPSFIFRDTNAPFADPLRNATAFVNAPLSPHRASHSLQHVLRCIGMQPEEASLYSPACCRRFLPTVSRFCGMSSDLRVELGRWCGSLSAALPDSPPAAASHAESLARMPDLYSRAHAEQIVLPILQQAIDACAAVVTRHGVDALPLHGGWDLFEPMGLMDDA